MPKLILKEHYDVIIIGSGPSGIFTSYEIRKSDPAAKVLIIEKGRSIEKRKCPKRKTGTCSNCHPCAITTGFSGGGSFSDGKLSINADGEIGGDLATYIGLEKFRETLAYVDDLYVKFGADSKVYGEITQEVEAIRRSAAHAHLKLIDSHVRHMGTEKAYEIYSRIQQELEHLGVELLFDTSVEDILIEKTTSGEQRATGVILADGTIIHAKHVVAAIGREGSGWLKSMCHKYGISSKPGPVDIGVRVETDASITSEIDSVLYEAKLVYYTPTFEDKVRTFCWNPRGEVVEEKYGDHLAVVNGHSYKEEKMKTTNTNFALLVSKNFTHPFKTPIEYGRYIAEMGNMLSGNKVIVQRYGDFKRGRRTTPERLAKNTVRATLRDAVPGDLSLVLPYRIMVAIDETLEVLDKIMPGIAGGATLLYGVEVKFYSNRLVVDKHFETSIKNLYALGDGAGLTRGLMQASMNGVAMGRILTGTW